MTSTRLKTLLRQNPKAAKHADSIRETMIAVKRLRAAGVGGSEYDLRSPYRGKALGNLPKSPMRKMMSTAFKKTKNA
jgi:hypothetical protein